MNPVDIAAIALLVLSALFGLVRGFVREALGLAAWVGAGLLCVQIFPYLRGPARQMISNTAIADIAAYAVGFLVLVILFSLLAGVIGGVVQKSLLRGVDRVLGFVFGAARGAVLTIALYIVGNLLVPVGQWPGAVRGARATPLAYRGAEWIVSLVPERLRPHIEAPVATGETAALREGDPA